MKASRLESVFTDKHYDLVVQCKQGSKTACFQLYRLYAKAMLNVAFRIVGNSAEAEDVLQESFLDAFSRLKQFRQETTFGLWLKQIVIHRAISTLRKKHLELVELEPAHADELIAEDAEEDDMILYKSRQVKEAINELPDGYRVVLSLYLLEGYDHEEIGQILHISENTSRTQFLRAKRKLSAILLKKGITS